ncbi:hypothetical protein GCM10023230_29760 [Flavobacterium hankyongi]|uniref:Uncharacterized protein n=1 Tax=Flavobacterium hankyongi TaxID=1176532 RepID=A0ABP9A8Z9_9FLAO
MKQKIVLKVTRKNSTEFEFTEIKREPFDKIIDIWNNNEALSRIEKKETIEFYFCQAQENEEEATVLLINSRSKFSFQFDTEIQKTDKSEFEKVPNVGTHRNSKTQESWAWKIKQIRISNFRLKK